MSRHSKIKPRLVFVSLAGPSAANCRRATSGRYQTVKTDQAAAAAAEMDTVDYSKPATTTSIQYNIHKNMNVKSNRLILIGDDMYQNGPTIIIASMPANENPLVRPGWWIRPYQQQVKTLHSLSSVPIPVTWFIQKRRVSSSTNNDDQSNVRGSFQSPT